MASHVFRRSVTVGANLGLTGASPAGTKGSNLLSSSGESERTLHRAITRRTTANVTGTARVDVFAIKMQKIEASKANRSVARSPTSPYAARAPASFSGAVVVDNMEAA